MKITFKRDQAATAVTRYKYTIYLTDTLKLEFVRFFYTISNEVIKAQTRSQIAAALREARADLWKHYHNVIDAA